MKQLSSDWHPAVFPSLLDDEISKFLRLTRFNTPWSNALIVIGIGVFLLVAFHRLGRADLGVTDYLIFLVPLLLLAGVTVLVQHNSLAQHGEQAVETILRSGLLGRLPEAADWVGVIYLWTPTIPAALFLGPPPETMQRWAWVLANNLDWYFQAPRRYIRRDIYPLAVMVLLFLAWFPLAPYRQNTEFLLAGIATGCLVTAIAAPWSFFLLMKKQRTLQVFQQLLRSGGVSTDQPELKR